MSNSTRREAEGCPACGETNCMDHTLRTMTVDAPKTQEPERVTPLNPETLKAMKEAAEKALRADVPATPTTLKREAFFDFQLLATPATVSALIAEVERLRLGMEVALRNAQLIDRIRLWSKCADGYPLDEHINNIATKVERQAGEIERLTKLGGCQICGCIVIRPGCHCVCHD